MNKKILGVVAVVLLISGGVLLVLASGDDGYTNNQQIDTVQNTTSADTTEDTAMASTDEGKYIDYSSEAISEARGIKVLFFHASWCSTCKALDQNIRAGKVPAGVTIFNVNYDTENELKNKYGVRYQHTLVQVDDNGEELKEWYGSYTIQQIMDQVI